jgi:hypothetical protein
VENLVVTRVFADHAPAFDHRLDNYIGEKKDLRFARQEDAEVFATCQYMAYGMPHSVLLRSDDMYMVVEDINPQIPGSDHTVVFHINSMPGEG